MGIELELLVLLALAVIGPGIFARFDIETPAWRKISKWFIDIGATLGLYRLFGHWALICPLFATVGGITSHFIWCHKHSIHPIRVTPSRKYYQLRGWPWRD